MTDETNNCFEKKLQKLTYLYTDYFLMYSGWYYSWNTDTFYNGRVLEAKYLLQHSSIVTHKTNYNSRTVNLKLLGKIDSAIVELRM